MGHNLLTDVRHTLKNLILSGFKHDSVVKPRSILLRISKNKVLLHTFHGDNLGLFLTDVISSSSGTDYFLIASG